MWIEEFETVLIGEKPTPETAPFYISKIGVPIEWGSESVKKQYESASNEIRESMDRATFMAVMAAVLGDSIKKVETSPTWTGKELTLREEKEIPDFRFWMQVKDQESADPKAVLFAVDWKGNTIKRRFPDGSEVEAIYLWHLRKEPSSRYFRQLSMFRAEYGYYLDFRYYVLRRPGQQIQSCRKQNGSIDLEALGLEEPGMWVHWKIKEPRAEEMRRILRAKYFKST
ncbi:MAG: hypothetical protein QXV01_10675, partial [Candidatus Bathyarchaeia archaeon]